MRFPFPGEGFQYEAAAVQEWVRAAAGIVYPFEQNRDAGEAASQI